MAFRLAIEDGPYVQTLHVASDRLTVGKGGSNQLRLTAGGVARRHAMVRQDGDALVFTDLHSQQGLVVEGRKQERVELRTGETVTLGAARITVLEVEEAPKRPQREKPALAPPAPSPAPPKPVPRPATTGVVPIPAKPRRQAFQEVPEFSDLAYDAMRQTPWWFASVLTHALLLLLLTFVSFDNSAAYKPVDANVVVGAAQENSLDEEDDPLVAPPDPFEDMERPEPEPLDPAEPEQPEPPEEDADPLQTDPEFAAPGVHDLPEPDENIVGLDTAGIAAGALGSRFGKDGAGRANEAAAKALGGNPFSRSLLRGLRLRTTDENVWIVKGQYDKCEKVFGILGLEHGLLTHDALAAGVPSQDVRAIFVNCTGEELPPRARRNLREWVDRGGHLFTTDWGVENVCHACFPGRIEPLYVDRRKVMTKDTTIPFRADRKHPYLKGMPINDDLSKARWWLEDSSYPVVVKDKENVHVLMRSEELGKRWASDVVAVTFPHGRGHVVHVIGHLYQREGNLRGAVAMQRLLLNFLYRAIRKR